MVKNYLWIVILLYLTLFAYLSADLTGAVLKNKATSDTISTQISAPQNTPAVDETKSREKWTKERIIKIKNIFNPEAVIQPEAPAEVSPENAESQIADSGEISETTLNYKLLGIAYGPPELAAAVIFNGSDQKLLMLNEKLDGGQTLVKVERDRIIIDNNGKLEYLMLDEDEKSSMLRRRDQRRLLQERIGDKKQEEFADASASQYTISKREKDFAVTNIGSLMTQIRVVPNLRRGKMDGFKVFEIRKNSIFEKAGLQNGDVVKQINGVVMENAETALKLFEQIKDEDRFSVDLLRKGSKLHFDIDVR